MEELILIFLEKVVEAIYFAMFLLIGKNIKNKKLLFIGIMVFEYLALKYFIKYNVWFQIIYTFMSFVTLKVLYKNKAQVTDIFLFTASSVVLILISILCSSIVIITQIYSLYYIMLIVNRVMMFLFLFIFKDKIKRTYYKFMEHWNKHTKPNTIKSLTLRNISIIVFNISFYVINSYMIYAIITRKWGGEYALGR